MSVNYSLVLKKENIKIPMMIDGEKVGEVSSLSFIDHATSYYTSEKLFNKYFKNSKINLIDNEFCIRYYYQKIRELPCIFNDKYIFIITNPELNFFAKKKIKEKRIIWDTERFNKPDSLLNENITDYAPNRFPLIEATITSTEVNNLKNLNGIMSKKDPTNPEYRENYAVSAKKPSVVLTNLFIKLFNEYRYDFQDFYNKEISSFNYTVEYKTKEINHNRDHVFLDYFKLDKKNKLSSEMFYFIEEDLTNYKRFRTCYYIIKKFCIKEIGMKEQDFIDYFYKTISIVPLEKTKVETTYEQTSLFKK